MPDMVHTQRGQQCSQRHHHLTLTPGRRVFAGVASPWNEAPPDEIEAFLARWQSSRWALKRSAYDGLHQLVMAAWYAQPRAWASIGYPGSPSLAV